MANKRRIFALLLCAAVVLGIFVSSALIAHEMLHPHDCTGEDCPVCALMAHSSELKRSLALILFAAFALMGINVPIRRNGADCAAFPSNQFTLTGLKVRLND